MKIDRYASKAAVWCLALAAAFSFVLAAQAQSPAAPAEEPSLCSDLFRFGSVQVSLATNLGRAVAGTELPVTATVTNENGYPIVDGSIYVKIFREQESESASHRNSEHVVDQFFAVKDIHLEAGGSAEESFVWTVPSYAVSGTYQVVPYFLSGDQFNLLGLSASDDVHGKPLEFSVRGDMSGTVAFDKNSVRVANAPYSFAALLPVRGENELVTIEAEIENGTDSDEIVPVSARVYSWDSTKEDYFVREVPLFAEIAAGDSKTVSLVVEDVLPVTLVVLEAPYKDTKSILNIRFGREGIAYPRINFSGLDTYPLEKGEAAEIFTCVHGAGGVPLLPDGKIVLSLETEKGRVIHSETYEGPITGALMGIRSEFVPKGSFGSLVLKTEAYQGGTLTDSSKLTYPCEALAPELCKGTGGLLYIALIALLLALIAIVILLVSKRKPPAEGVGGAAIALLIALSLFGGFMNEAAAQGVCTTGPRQGQIPGSPPGNTIPSNCTGWDGCNYTGCGTDLCPNMAGNQTSIPPGFVVDGSGQCVQYDACSNMSGIQSSVPSGYVRNNSGQCTPYTSSASTQQKSVTWVGAIDNQANARAWQEEMSRRSAVGDKSGLRDAGGGSHMEWALNTAEMSVSYGAQMVNEATGEIISDGSSVPVGTRIRFQYTTFRNNDVSWMITGMFYGTPYGYFRENLSSSENICASDNLFWNGGATIGKDYAAGIVNRPSVTTNISGSSASLTDRGGGVYEVAGTGSIVGNIVFAPTSGAIEIRNIPQSQSSCTMNSPVLRSFSFSVPEQRIAFNLAAAPSVANNAPAVPTITGPSGLNTGASGTFSVVSSDPDGDALYYNIIYGNVSKPAMNAAADQIVPASGTAPSGSSRSFNKSWAASGTQIMWGQAVDSKGAKSDWSSYTVNVSAAADIQPEGYLDSANCSAFTGWAVDRDTPTTALSIHFYANGPAGSGTFIGAVTANQSRPDVNSHYQSSYGINVGNNHGYSFPTPASLKDGNPHPIYAYAINSNGAGPNPVLGNSPISITCAQPPACTPAWSNDQLFCGSQAPGGPYTSTCSSAADVGKISYWYDGRANCGGPSVPGGYLKVCTNSCVPASPYLTLGATPTTIDEGDSSVLAWSSSGVNSCVATGAWSGSKALSGSQSVSPAQTATYGLTCSNSAVCTPTGPACTISITAGGLGGGGTDGSYTLYPGWGISVDNRNGASACGADVSFEGGSVQNYSGVTRSVPAGASRGEGPYAFVANASVPHRVAATASVTCPAGTTPVATGGYTASCNLTQSSCSIDGYGRSICNVDGCSDTKVIECRPAVSQTCSAATVTRSVTVTVVPAPSVCTDPSATNFNGPLPCAYPPDMCTNIPGFQATVPSGKVVDGSGNCVDAPDVCPNIPGAQSTVPPGKMVDGSGNCVDMPPSLPSVTLSADDYSVFWGGSTVLRWTSANAASCTASGAWSGSKALSGSEPTGGLWTDKTYTITCTNAAGSASKTVMVNVGTAAACSDSLDNDGDGKIDYPNDPGCSGPSDDDETDTTPPPACSDATDNDGDGLADSADPDCHTDNDPGNPGSYDPNDPTETGGGGPQCSDGIDNDGDGDIDHPDDSECSNPSDPDEFGPSGSPSVNLTASPSGTVSFGSNVTLVYTLTDFSSGDSCNLSGGQISGNPNPITSSGSRITGRLDTPGNYAYTLSCTNGLSDNASFTVDSLPTGIILMPANGSDYLNIFFRGEGPANSEVKTVNIASFSLSGTVDVVVDVAGLDGDWQGATPLISINGGPFSADPAPITLGCNTNISPCASFTVQTNVPSRVETTASGPIITLQATPTSGTSGDTLDLILKSTVNPIFEEF